MIEKQVLGKHYVEYASQPDEWVSNMEITKHSIVQHVLNAAPVTALSEPIKVVVLGASDKRYIAIHARVFSDVLGKKVKLSTLDVDTEHLGNGTDVVEHDVTKAFPHAPYAVVFSHELMKFLTKEEQIEVIKNSYDALGVGGVAMHIMHEPSIKGTKELRSWQHRVDPDELLQQLAASDIPARKLVFQSESTVEWLRETTVIVLQKAE